jgi:two-component system cell cycle response regulator DivK
VPKILIVEDSSDNMKLFRTLLTLKGHEVNGLPGGEGLLEMIERATPDLVLMDIQLPGKDGYALLEEIRRSPYASLRVVALSAHAMAGDSARALEFGFDGYITKPIDIRAFPDLITRAINGERLQE